MTEEVEEVDVYDNIQKNLYKNPPSPSLQKGCANCGSFDPWENCAFCPNCGAEYKKMISKRKLNYKEEIKKYRQKCNAIHKKFKEDALQYVDVALDHPKADTAFALAWEYGHSDGLISVINYLEDLAGLIN